MGKVTLQPIVRLAGSWNPPASELWIARTAKCTGPITSVQKSANIKTTYKSATVEELLSVLTRIDTIKRDSACNCLLVNLARPLLYLDWLA